MGLLFLFLVNSYSLPPTKLKLDLCSDHDVEQLILFQVYSTQNINKSYAPLKFSINFCLWLILIVYISSSLNLNNNTYDVEQHVEIAVHLISPLLLPNYKSD